MGKAPYNFVIYTFQTLTILSQQNKRDIGTFKLHNIYKRFAITVVRDFKKSDFEINAVLDQTPHRKRWKFNKHSGVESNKYGNPLFVRKIVEIARLPLRVTILVLNAPRVYSGGWRDSRSNKETVATSPQLAFTECFAPAMQASDWSLDNCDVNLYWQ